MYSRIAICVIIFSSCAVYGQSKGYVNKSSQLEFKYFDNWTLEEMPGHVMVFAPSEGVTDHENENLGISIAPANGMSLDECYNTYVIHALPKALDQYNPISQGIEAINGSRARWIEIQFKAKDGLLTTNLIYVLVSNEKLYIIVAYSSTKKFSTYKEKFLSIIRTLSVK